MSKVRANPKFSMQKSDGTPAEGWKVNFYIAGTSTRKDTYTDNTEGSANTNPVILDARGEADIWAAGTYKVIVTDENDVQIWSVDNWGKGEDQTQTGNYNLVLNGSFETDATSSGEPDDWTLVDYADAGSGAGVHSLDATDQYHGLNSLKFVSVGDGGGHATSAYFEVQEAKPINIDWAMKSSVVGVRNVVDILWATSAKSAISTTNIYDDSATNPTSWTAKNGTATPPSTARYAQIRVYGCHSSDSTSGSTWFDDVQVTDNVARKHTTNTFTGVNTFTATQKWSKGADLGDSDVDGSNILTIGTDGNYFDYTGTDQIDEIATVGVGTVIKIHFDAICQLTHDGTDFILPNAANITTAAGDEAEFFEYASADWRCTNYTVASSGSVASGTVTNGNTHDHSGGDGGTIPIGGLNSTIIPWIEISSTSETTGVITFEGLDTTYDEFMLVVGDATIGTDGSEFHIHIGHGATPTYLTASGYSEAGTGAGTASGWWLSNSQGNAAGESCSAIVHLFKIHESAPTKCIARSAWQDISGVIQGYDFVGLQSYAAEAITAIRVDNTTGTQSTGDIKLYGRRK